MQTWELAPTLPWKYRAQSKAPFGPVKPSMVCTTSSRLVPPLELFGLGVQTLVSAIAPVLPPAPRPGAGLGPAPRLALDLDRGLGERVGVLQLDLPGHQLVVGVLAARPDQAAASVLRHGWNLPSSLCSQRRPLGSGPRC